MKTTKIILALATVLLLSLFATSCIPTTPTGGNPTPTPQTDTTVVYKLVNRVVVDVNDNTNPNQNHISVDLDSNGVSDIDFSPFQAYGVAVTNIERIGLNELISKSSVITADEYAYAANDTIQPSHFALTTIRFGSRVSSKSVLVGFKLIQNDGPHYGWMKLNMDATFSGAAPTNYPTIIKTTLVNYAFKKAPNTPILAGKY